ncbi:MAG TPA: coproporphyrinogen III oxidase, partial [Saprospiraceae bacterium]|nr:coproporphyrinogen III oxidase [Saprospiraceae bacterium]
MSFELLQKYDVAVPRYTSYPPVPAWAIPAVDEQMWKTEIIDGYDTEKGLSLYIHLPYCEQLCTYCGCNKRITINHSVEIPYINTVLKEWNSYIQIFGDKIPKIKELHLGGGTPTFFDPTNLKLLIDGIFEKAVRAEDAAL